MRLRRFLFSSDRNHSNRPRLIRGAGIDKNHQLRRRQIRGHLRRELLCRYDPQTRGREELFGRLSDPKANSIVLAQ